MEKDLIDNFIKTLINSSGYKFISPNELTIGIFKELVYKLKILSNGEYIPFDSIFNDSDGSIVLEWENQDSFITVKIHDSTISIFKNINSHNSSIYTIPPFTWVIDGIITDIKQIKT